MLNDHGPRLAAELAPDESSLSILAHVGEALVPSRPRLPRWPCRILSQARAPLLAAPIQCCYHPAVIHRAFSVEKTCPLVDGCMSC